MYIKAHPQLNGKVERSYQTDQAEFYRLLTYLNGGHGYKREAERLENFYHYDWTHLSWHGKTPYRVMKPLLQEQVICPARHDVK